MKEHNSITVNCMWKDRPEILLVNVMHQQLIGFDTVKFHLFEKLSNLDIVQGVPALLQVNWTDTSKCDRSQRMSMMDAIICRS